MLAFVMARRFNYVLAIPLGLVLAGSIAYIAGAGNNAQVLGIPLGKQTVPMPSGQWLDTLNAEAAAHELTDWQAEDSDLSYKTQPRRSYYRAKLAGKVNDKPVTVDVELQAADGGEWQLVEWSER